MLLNSVAWRKREEKVLSHLAPGTTVLETGSVDSRRCCGGRERVSFPPPPLRGIIIDPHSSGEKTGAERASSPSLACPKTRPFFPFGFKSMRPARDSFKKTNKPTKKGNRRNARRVSFRALMSPPWALSAVSELEFGGK